MLPLKRISGVFLRCMIYYGLLIAPWPGVMDGYRAFFRAGGAVAYKNRRSTLYAGCGHRRYKSWMCRYGLLRRFCGEHVYLEQYLFARSYENFVGIGMVQALFCTLKKPLWFVGWARFH